MVIEAAAITGYVIAWAVRKARRIAGRLDNDADAVIDGLMDQLDEVVVARLAGHPVLEELAEEATRDGQVSELTRQQVELALTAAARKDEAFGQVVTELVARLRGAGAASGPLVAGPGATIFAGDARAEASNGGIAIGQASGGVHISREPQDPTGPGRSGH